MINKKNLWFLTLFSLVLVLSIYYVTMPSEVFTESKKVSTDNITTDEVSLIDSMKLEDDALVLKEINDLKEKLVNSELSSEEKNTFAATVFLKLS